MALVDDSPFTFLVKAIILLDAAKLNPILIYWCFIFFVFLPASQQPVNRRLDSSSWANQVAETAEAHSITV